MSNGQETLEIGPRYTLLFSFRYSFYCYQLTRANFPKRKLEKTQVVSNEELHDCSLKNDSHVIVMGIRSLLYTSFYLSTRWR